MAAGIHDRIRWINQMPQQELFALYRTMHCFLFPSLHDSSGNVVLEAQANGLPVICLSLGGPAVLVGNKSGIVVSVDGKSESQVVADLATAIEQMVKAENQRQAMARAAIEWVSREMSWCHRVNGMLALAEKYIAKL
jgi:glycosyltransferase involved in cell wall biosynthesis